MHKLDRTTVPAPQCLASYKYGAQNWDAVTPEDKQEIRVQLEQLQGRRCAYCESSLDSFGEQIEHFRRKGNSAFVHLTFAWNNLFWSCDCADCCGHYKDHGAGPYDPDHLIDPTVDDPERFLRFVSDGSIRIRPGLTPAEQHRAAETLRVFKLDPEYGRLRKLREVRVRQYHQTNPDYLTALEALDSDGRREFIQFEIAATAHEPFATTIKHVLESLS